LAAALRPAPAPAQPSSDPTAATATREAERYTTKVTLTVSRRGEAAAAIDRAFALVLAELDRIDALFSEWRPDTPVSALNRRAGEGPVEVPAEVFAILEQAAAFAKLTEGAFDPTFKTLAPLWRFRDPQFSPPTLQEVSALLPATGIGRLRLNAKATTAALTDRRTQLGLGGVVKGYALERSVRILRREGLKDFCLRIGGDLYCAGDKAGRPWVVGVRHPRHKAQVVATLEVRDAAFTTSGDYERFADYQGRRYHHIIDLRTGFPARGVQSATVLARSPTEADALSTAVFVMGVKRGLALIEGMPGAEALIVDDAGRLWPSTGLQGDGQLEIVSP
jgi:thiamine biosynthesis lipoprotein